MKKKLSIANCSWLNMSANYYSLMLLQLTIIKKAAACRYTILKKLKIVPVYELKAVLL